MDVTKHLKIKNVEILAGTDLQPYIKVNVFYLSNSGYFCILYSCLKLHHLLCEHTVPTFVPFCVNLISFLNVSTKFETGIEVEIKFGALFKNKKQFSVRVFCEEFDIKYKLIQSSL